MSKRRIIVGVSGASGFIFGVRTLELLRAKGCETHLVITSGAERTRSEECELSADRVRALADASYRISDIGAAIASGSFRTMGMIIAPCSIHTLSQIAYAQADNLLTRAADVCLKERRRVVLLVRETPLHAGHLRAMLAATEAGAIVMPPVPAFYLKPRNIDELVHHTVARALDLFDINVALARWGERNDDPPEDARIQEARHVQPDHF